MEGDSEEGGTTEDGPTGSTEAVCRASSGLAETPWIAGETTGAPTEVTRETEGVEGECAVTVSSPPRLSSLIRSQILGLTSLRLRKAQKNSHFCGKFLHVVIMLSRS